MLKRLAFTVRLTALLLWSGVKFAQFHQVFAPEGKHSALPTLGWRDKENKAEASD